MDFSIFVAMYKQFDQMDFKQVEFVGRTYYHIIFCWIRFTHERRLIKWSNCLCYRSNAIHNASTWIILCWQNTWTLCCNDGENGTYHLLLSCMRDKQIHSCPVTLVYSIWVMLYLSQDFSRLTSSRFIVNKWLNKYRCLKRKRK